MQLTNFADSASAPSLSPDGRMVTFKRGGDAVLEPRVRSTSSCFRTASRYSSRRLQRASTDRCSRRTDHGSRIHRWTVRCLGHVDGSGARRRAKRLLPNASGLTWITDQRVLFSEIKTGIHMGIVTATESRAESREIYIQPDEHAMVHYSYASPDRQSVLVVEMTGAHAFTQPCRLLPFDGSSAGRQVGPQGTCTVSCLVSGRTVDVLRRGREAARTSGVRGFLTEHRSRSPSARSKRKASRWRRTVGRS